MSGRTKQLPSGWFEAEMSELVPRAQYGISSSLNARDGIPILRMNNLVNGSVDVSNLKFSETSEVENLLLNHNDVLFNRTNSLEHVGRTSLWRSELPKASFASYLVRLVPDDERLDAEFLVRWMNLPESQISIRRFATPGVHQVNVNPTNLRRLRICVPRKTSEQRKIARILTTLDNLIEKTEALIDKYQAIKQGMMHDLFTRGVDSSGQLRPTHEQAPDLYKPSELGFVPKNSEVVPLSTICELQVGYAFKSAWFQEQEGVRLLRGENVGYGSPDWKDTQRLPKSLVNSFSEYLLEPGDVVIGMDRTFTKSGTKITVLAQSDCPCLLVQRVGRFRPTNCDAGFLRMLLGYAGYQHELRRQEKGMDIPHLSQSEILAPLVIVPQETEQPVVAERLRSLFGTISHEELHLAKLRQQKSGLMQDLLTGKVRVKVDETEEVAANA